MINLSLGMKVLIAGTLLFMLIGGIGAVSLIGVHNDCVQQEAALEAQYKQNQNNYANYFNSLKEMAQVPKMYAADMEKVYKSVIEGRYKNDGPNMMFKWIQEHNPNFDASLYKQIQQAIESGRESFKADQKALLQKKENYEVTLNNFPGNIVAGMFGFPKKDISKFDIVINEETEKAFETKKAGPIQL